MLHGIPFSAKDHIQIKDTVSTNGIGSNADMQYLNTEDCVVVKALKNAGILEMLIQFFKYPL